MFSFSSCFLLLLTIDLSAQSVPSVLSTLYHLHNYSSEIYNIPLQIVTRISDFPNALLDESKDNLIPCQVHARNHLEFKID